MQIILVIFGAACLIWAISPVVALVYGGTSKDEVISMQRQAVTNQSNGVIPWLFKNRMLVGWVGTLLLLAALLA
jgi:hypothetical protein